MKAVSKYAYIFVTHWQAALEYRAELFLWALFHAIPLASILLLWSSVYSNNQQLPGYTLEALITYYVVGYVITRFIITNIELEYMDEIRSGTISKYFLKPVSLKVYMTLQELSWRVLNFFLITLPLVMILALFLPSIITIPSITTLVLMTLLLVPAFIINILTSLLITGIAFFIDQGRTLTHLKWMLEGIFNGSLLPLTLYPDFLEKIARILPFQLQFAVPIELYLNKTSPTAVMHLCILALFWIAALGIGVKIVWHKALTHFTAVGS